MAVVFTLAIALSPPMYAQRPVNKLTADSSHVWYDSSTFRYQKAFPYPATDPPLNSGMPLDVFAGYVYMDSLFRTATTWQSIQRIRSWNSLNDTLLNIGQYLYEVDDYNPMTLAQYFSDIAYSEYPWINWSGVGPHGYQSQPNIVKANFARAYENFSPDSLKNALFALLSADCIYRVQVVSLDSIPGEQINGVGHIYNVHVNVEDIIKGEQYPPDTSGGELSSIKSHHAGISTSNTLSFIYSDQYSYVQDQDYETFTPDSAFLGGGSGSYPIFRMQPGQDAIVFLNYDDPVLDSTHLYPDLEVDQAASYCALPIISGNVRDINHIWSSSDSLAYTAWKNRCEAYIQMILTH